MDGVYKNIYIIYINIYTYQNQNGLILWSQKLTWLVYVFYKCICWCWCIIYVYQYICLNIIYYAICVAILCCIISYYNMDYIKRSLAFRYLYIYIYNVFVLIYIYIYILTEWNRKTIYNDIYKYIYTSNCCQRGYYTNQK